MPVSSFQILPRAGGFSILDPGAPAQAALRYRVTWQLRPGTVLSAETNVAASLATSLGLAISPNPSRGAVFLRATVGPTLPARIRIFDLRGRQLWEQVLPPAGNDRGVVWNGRDMAGRPAAAGVYQVELRQGRSKVIRSFVHKP
jgi:hypothetical protein